MVNWNIYCKKKRDFLINYKYYRVNRKNRCKIVKNKEKVFSVDFLDIFKKKILILLNVQMGRYRKMLLLMIKI